MGMRSVGVGVVGIGVLSAGALGQGFPFVTPAGIQSYTHPAFVHLLSAFTPYDEAVSGSGDVTGDGRDDFVVVLANNSLPTLVVYPGLEGGGLGDPVRVGVYDFEVEGSETERDLDLVDFDGDGDLDIATLSSGGRVALVENLGGGNYAFVGLSSGAEQVFMDSFDLVDVDDDGVLDVLMWSIFGRVVYRSGLVDGAPNIQVTNALGSSKIQVRAGDLDGDGDTDLAIVDGAELLVSYQGSGVFGAPVPWGVTTTNFVASGAGAALADVNGDGVIDGAVLGSSNGSDVIGFVHGPIQSGETRNVMTSPLPDGFSFDGVFGVQESRPTIWGAGDLDGDGTEELMSLVARVTDPMDLNGRFGLSREYQIFREDFNYAPEGALNNRTFVDLNNDGVKDRVVFLDAKGQNTVGQEFSDDALFLVGTIADIDDPERITEGLERIGVAGTDLTHVLAVDTDFDGDPELLHARSSVLRIADRDVDGRMSYNQSTRFSTQLSTPRGFLGVEAQFDSDPGVDVVSLVQASGASFPAVYLNIESGPFGVTTINAPVGYDGSALASRGLSFESSNSDFAIGDVDGDGDEDIVMRGIADDGMGGTGDSLLCWINDGEGAFSDGALTFLGSSFIDDWSAVSISMGDYDNDGVDELVAIREDDLWYAGYYENDGAGSFSLVREVELTYGSRMYWTMSGDFDDDGYEDALVMSLNDFYKPYYGGVVDVMYGSDTGLGEVPVRLLSRMSSTIEVLSEDVDGNGLEDLIVTTSAFNRESGFQVMFQTSPRVYTPTFGVLTEQPSGMTRMDVDRDGARDLVWTKSGLPEMGVTYGVDESCAADLNLDGALDFFDVSAFLGFYSDERPIADFTRDGEFDFFDLSAFLGAYAQGCP